MNHSLFQHKPLLGAALLATLLAGMTSCQDEDFGYNAEDIKYAKAYEDFFGKLPEDKSWDLSSATNRYHYDATGNSSAITRANGVTPSGNQLVNSATGEYQIKENYWVVPQKTFDWMKAALKEGKDNRYLGSPFVLQLPDNDFAIIPIFQGKSSIMTELEIKINGYQITKVWERSQNIQVKDSKISKGADSEGWMNLGYYEGYSSIAKFTMKSEGDATMVDGVRHLENLPMHPSYTDESEAVRAKPIYFRSKNNIGKSDKGFMYLSLHNIDKAWASWTNYDQRWDEGNDWTTINHRLTSINPNGHMLALNVPSQYRPSPSELPNISEDGSTPSQVIFVSCEDANGVDTDHDVNDVAFLIIGYPNAPTIVPTTEVIKKRYMCEDLGGTYDYDFNDIVVDVTQTQKYSVQATPNELETYDETTAGSITIEDMVPVGCPIQTAKIAHLCGTIPVQVQIGSFMFPKIRNPRNNNNADGAETDGKYDSRRILAGNWEPLSDYYLYNHTECPYCKDHDNIPADNETTKGRITYHHKNFTRGTTQGWNPNEEQIIPCHTWNPDQNNIIIYADWGYTKTMYTAGNVPGGTYDQSTDANVKHSNPFPEHTDDFADFASGKKFAVSFPKTGEYPYIIATDQDVPWMKEGEHIPTGWVSGDMTARSDASGSKHDLIGNSFYMENYGNGDHWEGYIWSGDVTGLAGSTGVTFAKPSAELNALDESFGTLNGGHWYYLLHVYAVVPAGETAYIGLYDPQTWEPIQGSDPDGYLIKPISERLHHSELGVSGMQCATIYLTQAQRDYILAHGLTVASRTDGVRLKKVTTARPCLYTTNTVTGSGVDGGFIVNIKASEINNGWILSDESVREQVIIEAERGKELTAAEVAHNNAEPDRVKVPFTKHQFISGTTITLTAIGKTVDEENSYRVTGWNVQTDNSGNFTVSDNSKNPLTITGNNPESWATPREITVYPIFVPAENPKLKWEGTPTQANKTITLALNGASSCKLYATSLNLSSESMLDQFGGNTNIVGAAFGIEGGKHVITLTPITVGETTFTIYQKDGNYNGQDYGVSGELKLTVKVIAEVPSVTHVMDKSCFYRWSGGSDVNAYIINDNTSLAINLNKELTSDNTKKEVLYGDINAWGHAFADLSQATTLVVGVSQGDIEFIFNREGEYGASTTVNTQHKACSVIVNYADGTKAYVIDLTQLRKNGKTHLNAIFEAKAEVPTQITSIKVDYACSNNWKNLKNKISSATTSLSVNNIYEWSDDSAAATTNGTQNTDRYLWKGSDNHATEAGEVIYGDTWTLYNNYVDLSKATVIVATVPKNGNEIEFAFNKKPGTGDNASWNGDFVSVRPANEYSQYCAVIEDGDNYKYVIDADGLKNKLGVNYLHLNFIRKPYNGDNTETYIISLSTDAYSAPLYGDAAAISTLKQSTASELAPAKTGDGWAIPRINTGVKTVYGIENAVEETTLYDDLDSRVTYIKIVVYNGGVPRFYFNYDISDHSSGFTISSSTNSQYMYKETNPYGYPVYYIDLDKLRRDKGNAHLNSIKSSAYNEDIVVSDLKLGIRK